MSLVTDKASYEDTYCKWLKALPSEIHFWKAFMETKGLQWHDHWETKISSTKPFKYEKYLVEGGDYRCIDVGCGPFPIGHKTDKANLHFHAIDPLGHAYNLLKKTFNIDDGVSVNTGYVEILHEFYEENTFDIVHMRNSLDHSFDPFHGLQELLFICKVGGKVILEHAENEALNQNYGGLHQWNLSVQNDENSFVIWSKNERHDVCKLLSDFASFERYPDNPKEKVTWNFVVITKTNPIPIPEVARHYSKMIHDCNYKFLLEVLTANLKA